ncbi:IclR family transcriptional regulator [Devosia sp. YIM 151766]|uniref:IclR family transcriptional regulator n=1 Tax=Devosia sp. YIM 151766 TaxID=3017325 RepID=UPI00255D0F05|nr:IclR family transcriptional regulator [Devosia sp. YIM 151766]WIY52734.1 IclR family transcriptional regulator [Devosia sp. YIM 151766]
MQAHVPALSSAKKIIDYICASAEPRGISDIAQHVHLPKSSVHRICWALVDLDILSDAGNAFQLGYTVREWANAFDRQTSLTAEFNALDIDMAALGHGTLNLSVLNGDQVVYVASRQGAESLGITFRVGMSLPAVFTATGKAMLSSFPEADIAAIARDWPEARTRRSVADVDGLNAELAACRERGFSIEDGQLREGMLCLGVPIFGPDTRAIAGLALGMLSAEVRGNIERYGTELRKIGDALSRRMGGRRQN